jgi:uncharacterized protein (TIGR02001 family)
VKPRIRFVAWILLLLACVPSARSADFWGGSIDVTTNYLVRGRSFSDDDPALQGDIHYHSPAGWLAGLFASTVKLGRNIPSTVELDAYVGYGLQLSDDWAARIQAVHYAYPWERISSYYEYDEFVGALAYRNALFFTITWSPDMTMVAGESAYRANRSALSYEFAAQVPIKGAFAASIGLGYFDLSEVAELGYWYWNAGLAYTVGSMKLDLAYVGTSSEAERIYYPGTAGDRVVATLSYHF